MQELVGAAAIAAVAVASILGRSLGKKRRRSDPSTRPPGRPPRPGTPRDQGSRRTYPGDFTGNFRPLYAPKPDGLPDPGEIVWTWVPYEDDHKQGKDRPVLLVGKDGTWLLGLMLTSKDHDRDAADEAKWGRRWMDIGAGPWDRERRPSEVRLDRIIRIHPDDVRREGAVLDERTFREVAESL